MIMNTMYGPTVNGLCGNDDAGQMSAWYVFSSLGFYPVTPGSSSYALGSPNIVEGMIQFGNGKLLTIKALGQSRSNVYVKSVRLNGREVEGFLIDHTELIGGGELVFEMTYAPRQQDPH
jgi:putative alpha-1,2-mannosidase